MIYVPGTVSGVMNIRWKGREMSSEAHIEGNAELHVNGRIYKLPLLVGNECEQAIDIRELRKQTGMVTYDPGYGNTASCQSAITFIDGERGILRYRGYPIEELAQRSTFVEVAYLLLEGELPSRAELVRFTHLLNDNALLHENMRHVFNEFSEHGKPMGILSAVLNGIACFRPELLEFPSKEDFQNIAAILLSQVRTIAAFSYRTAHGLPIVYPDPRYSYAEDFLCMMFSLPNRQCGYPEEVVRALDLIFILHADHEQNCSTSTVRMVGSSRANLFAAVSAGVDALWGPLHGGANLAVIEMLKHIQASGDDGSAFIEEVKSKKGEQRLMGFGHRVYKNFDPRAQIVKAQCDKLLAELHRSDPLLDIARHLEAKALSDSYFIERKLYPNVDFYSGIMMRAIGIPEEMFTVIFAIGRMPGWLAQYKELLYADSAPPIDRPRQIYVGPTQRAYVPISER
jgi:citrate synthase